MNREIFKSKKIFNYALVLKYIVFFLMMFVMWKAGIKNNIYPFAVGLFISLVWCGQNIFLMSGIFISCAYLSSFSTETLLFSVVCAGFIFIVYYIHKLSKKPIKVWQLLIYSVVSQFMLIYYNYSVVENLISAIMSIVIATIFVLCCIKIFKALLVRGIGLKLTIDETICLCTIICALSLGLQPIQVFNIELSKIFAIFMILICTYIYKNNNAVIVGAVMGLGQALMINNLILSAGYSIIALMSLTFKTSHVYYSCLAVILTELVLGLYFKLYGDYTIFSFLSVLIAEILFILINKNVLSILKIVLGGDNNFQASRNIVNRSKDALTTRMFEISNIFLEMDKVFRNMVKGVLPLDEAKKMLAQEVMQKVCSDCPEKYKCLRTLSDETNKVFDDIITAGFERGKATILDIPPFLTTRCAKVNTILQAVNQLIVSYKQYANMVSSMDTSRILIADQLGGVAQLLKALATDTQKNITFDINKENQIIEELNYFNILVSEVILYEKDENTFSVTMCIREKDKENADITKILSKICGCKMILASSIISQTPNFVVNEYKTAPKYDLVYGSSGCPKKDNTISGDSYSFIKLTDDKVLFVICDGMGNGVDAQKTSDTAISLIENFYKAGFDNEIILNSVNRFLSINGDENYSALDLCIVDLKTSNADFVKVGAPEGFIKHKDETEIMKSGALPLGILEDIQPTISKKLLDNSDMAIMCSNGVLDCFESIDDLKVIVNNSSVTNPQTMSETILDEALLRCKNSPKDDCIVVCVRVFNRV